MYPSLEEIERFLDSLYLLGERDLQTLRFDTRCTGLHEIANRC